MAKSKNERLKKAFKQESYTAEQVQELERCIVDPVHFIENHIKIKHPIKGQIKFELFPYQREIITNLHTKRNNLLLMPRQTGKTETVAAFLLWFAMFNSDKTVVIASNKSDNAMEIIAKIQNSYEEVEDYLKVGIDPNSWNKHTCQFDNKSRIMSFATAEDTGRGYAVSFLYCDEFAFVPDHIATAFWRSITPTLATGGACCVTSTPNGDTNKFAELWRQAEAGIGTFHPFTIPWNARPDRDEKFKQDIIADHGLIHWRQEFLCEFISSEYTLLDTEKVMEVEKSLVGFAPPFVIEGQSFYKKVNQDATYLVGVDPGTGSGADFTVIEVVEFPSMVQVMEYRTNSVSHPTIYDYLKKILRFLEHFTKEVYFSVESNGVGQGILALYEADEKQPEKAVLISDDKKDVLGMFTTDRNKIGACMILKSLFESNALKIFSPMLLKELKSYKRSKGSYEAKTGATDDCISAMLIVLRILQEISKYDSRAYHKLYTINVGNSSDEWIRSVYQSSEDGVFPSREDYDENAIPLPLVF